jgi:predicted transcriptional regulator
MFEKKASRMKGQTTTVQSAPVRAASVYTSLTAKDVMQRPVLAATPQAALRDVAIQLVANEKGPQLELIEQNAVKPGRRIQQSSDAYDSI